MKRFVLLSLVLVYLISGISVSAYSDGDAIAEKQYESGMEYFNRQDYDHAFSYFQISGDIKGYSPAQNMLGVCYRDGLGTEQSFQEAEKYFRLSADQGYAPAQANLALMNDQQIDFSLISKGDYFTFGAYEQDNNLANGPEPIEWIVLAKEEKKILIISRYGLDACPYYNYFSNVTWESSALRRWLRGFSNQAFNAEEQEMITDATVRADRNPDYSTDPGNSTTDKIFLLSITEVEKYLSSGKDRLCVPTAYAEKNGCYADLEESTCSWWLRSPGFSNATAAYVGKDGDLFNKGVPVTLKNRAVRPAMWINIGS